MNEYFLSYSELLVILIVGVIIGALLGLVPLLLGKRRNKRRLGMYGFIASIVAGAISPFLSLIVIGIFSWLIVKDNKAETNAGDTHAPSTSTDSDV